MKTLIIGPSKRVYQNSKNSEKNKTIDWCVYSRERAIQCSNLAFTTENLELWFKLEKGFMTVIHANRYRET